MIRIRTKDNKLLDLPDNLLFIEIVNGEGKVAFVINEDKKTQTYDMFDYTDIKKANNYSKFFKVDFIETIVNVDLNKDSKVNTKKL